MSTPDPAMPVVAYVWHQHLGEGSKSLRWSQPTQWDYTESVDALVRQRDAEARIAAVGDADLAHASRYQGGLCNEELRDAWDRKLPDVEPTDRELTAFALGVEVGDAPSRTYFAERNSARDAWRRRVKQCEQLEAAIAALQTRLDEAKKLLAWAEIFHSREGEDANDRFERVAEVFRRETGYLRPGKDCVIHSNEERQEAWDAWVAERLTAIRAHLAASKKESLNG